MDGFSYDVSGSDCGGRLDNFLTERLGITRSRITSAIKNGCIAVNNKAVKAGYTLRAGDVIAGRIEDDPITVLPEKMDLDIVYEDPYLMVINKPRGVVVHTGAGAKSGTLLNGLLGRAAANNLGRANNLEATAANLERAGIVHRLDKNTAGLLVVAKTAEAQSALGAMFEKHEIKRTYLGLVEGVVKGDMTIDKNIVRHKTARTLFTTTTAGGRRAITRLKVLEQYKKYTLCEFTLETGRTHQIRVHCKSINHAIVGDPEYNPNGTMKSLNGQMLSAVKLEFCHPITKKDINIEISASKQLTDAIKKCKNVV